MNNNNNNNKSQDSEAGNTNILFSTFCDYRNVETFWTLKKAGWHHHLLLNFLSFFFICLAITTDDIARHWESSSKAWETAMTNQVMRHGVIHLRVTLTVLPLWHTHTHRHSRTQTHTQTHTRTKPHTLKTEEALWVEKIKRKRTRLTRAQGRREQWDFIWKCKCRMNYYCNLVCLWQQICLFIKTLSSIFVCE